MTDTISQKTRLIVLGAEVVILCVGSYFAFGEIFPPNSDKGFWFYTALLGLILGNRLHAPFFAKPADVIIYAAPAVTALLLANSWANWEPDERLSFVLAVSYCVIAAMLSGIAILVMGSGRASLRRAAEAARVLAEVLGAPRIIFSVVILFALYTFHRSAPRELLAIGAAWVLTVAMSPIEGIARLWARLQRVWLITEPLAPVAEVVAFQTPGIVLLRKHQGVELKPGDIVLVNDGLEESSLALAVDKVGRDEGILIRALQDADNPGNVDIQRQARFLSPRTGAVIQPSRESEQASTLIRRRNTLVGLVAPDTTVEHLYFEVTKDDELEEGRLVEVAVGARTVTYQLVNGLTKEEIVQQKNTFGYVRAQAQKIGEWDQASQKFRLVKWLPKPNAPVFLQESSDFVPGVDLVGHFPGTNYGVSLKNIDDLVTHNTAILGILGIGKSTLAIELVERMLVAGIKVICLDLTNQYATELEPYVDKENDGKTSKGLQELGKAGKANVRKNVEEGGSRQQFSAAITKELESFLDPKSVTRIKIYSPAQFEVWRQDSKPYGDTASMASLTATEIAQIISDATLQVLQRQGMSDKARACLVFEEAHTLIPEWTAVAAEGDRTAANGTSRAILQGRKYGLGCLLITQRTANVTKTILNQCNTIFAMRTFDDTGKDFLANYIGREYADSLSSLSERQAVFYGRASSCENPVLIRLNDREVFQRVFREKYPPPKKRVSGAPIAGEGPNK